MTMKLCHRGKTFNIHDLHVCKQQQIASGNKTNVYGYNLVVFAILTMRLGIYTGTQYHSNVKTTFTSL